jgi:hypothetical protein
LNTNLDKIINGIFESGDIVNNRLHLDRIQKKKVSDETKDEPVSD